MGLDFYASDSRVTDFRYFWWLTVLFGSFSMPEMLHNVCWCSCKCYWCSLILFDLDVLCCWCSHFFPFQGSCFSTICLPGFVIWWNGSSGPYNPFKWPLSINTWLFSILNRKCSDTVKIPPISVLFGLNKSLEMAYSPLGSAFAVTTHFHSWSERPRSNGDDPFQAPLLY